MASEHDGVDSLASSPIPNKLYFKIGEVAKLVGVEAHVLRYWQSEIGAIRPAKSVSNQRRYRHRDVELFREIRRLLYEERYTLAGARRRILARESHGKDKDANRGEGGGTSALVPDAQKEQSPSVLMGEVVALPARLAPATIVCELDEELSDRLRHGLRDIIRLAGEEP